MEKAPPERKISIRMGNVDVSIDRSKFEKVVRIAEEVASEGISTDPVKEVSRRAEVSKGGTAAILRKQEQLVEARKRLEEQKDEH